LTRKIFGDWNVIEVKDSVKKVLVVVYSSRSEVVNVTNAARELIGQFRIRKVSLFRYQHSRIGAMMPISVTPAFVIADISQSTFQVAHEGWTEHDDMIDYLTDRPEKGIRIEWDSAFEKPQRFDWFWVFFGLVSILLLIIVLWLTRASVQQSIFYST
jgi:hypothetical protein